MSWIIVLASLGLALDGASAWAGCSKERRVVFPWKPIRVPKPSNLCDFVLDEPSAIRLGKAWFWDMQVGSDGKTACGSCHFHAGADNRVRNQISPHGAPESNLPDQQFEVAGPNGSVTASSFPFHRLENPENRQSTVISDSDDVFSSQGVFRTQFVDIVLGTAEELTTVVPDPVFQVQGVNTRQVEPRNTMTVINAIFNHEQFWDGRGKFYFNGVNPFGLLDPEARVLKRQGTSRSSPVARVKVAIGRGSVASQAVGPPTSPSEMSAGGRPFPKIGKKLLHLTPLGQQVVHPQDSVLGALSRDPGSLTVPGLTTSYATMIRSAFRRPYWDSDRVFDVNQNELRAGVPVGTDEFNLMEMNTSLFWGLAIQMYLSTLISDDSPFDRFMNGDPAALTDEEKLGKDIFFGHACRNCHLTPEMNKATVANLIEAPAGTHMIVERMKMAAAGALRDGGVYDGGFYNAGVRPTAEDLGRGGTVAIQVAGQTVEQPLSFTRLAQRDGEAANRIASPRLNPPLRSDEPIAVDGAFRVPTLRNSELTGPYYHNGGLATLRDVVMFYMRGGDFREINIDQLDAGIGGARFFAVMAGRPDNQIALAKFMGRALTDERVRYERAPFDRPEIFVPDGHVGDHTMVADDGRGQAIDIMLRIPPVGRDGRSEPLAPFLGLPPEALSP